MAMVRMTAKEMRKKYPLTSERIKELELLSQKEPDLSDPDNPELKNNPRGLFFYFRRPAFCISLANGFWLWFFYSKQ
jgi:hypothetical protein